MVFDFGAFLASMSGYSYIILFILMFIEGPMTAFAASFAAALGYFNIWIILVLFILGSQIPDVLIFKLGGFLRGGAVERFVSYFGLSKSRIKWLERNARRHTIKTMLIIKTVPPLPAPGILLSGFSKMQFKKFFWTDLIYNIVYSAIFIFLGYYSGLAADTSLKFFKIGEYLLPVAVILIIGVYLLIRWLGSVAVKNFKD